MHVRDLLRRFDQEQTAKIAEADADLGNRKASSWEDYHRRCGVNEGRRAAMADLRALIDKLTEDDDEDDRP